MLHKPYRILQISDIHLQEYPNKLCYGINTDNTLDQVLAELNPWVLPESLLVASGDLSDEGSEASYRRLRQRLQRTQLDYACLPGNQVVS